MQHAMRIDLFRAENPVAGVAEAGADVGILIELPVEMADVDLDVGMGLVQLLQALGGGDNAHELDLLPAVLLDHLDGVAGRSARSQHGVNDHDGPLFNRGRQLAVVFVGLVGLRVAVEADVADLGRGHQGKDAVDHAETCAEDGHDGHLLAGDDGAHGVFNGGLHGDFLCGQVPKSFIPLEHGNFGNQGPELVRARGLVPQAGNLVLNQGMLENDDIRHVHVTKGLDIIFHD